MKKISEVDMQGVRFVVRGLVQGVFFRVSTRRVALRYGIYGWVKNLPDGCVEVVASGEDRELDGFRDWLHHGPDGARVDEVTEHPIELRVPDDFHIR